MKAKHFAVIMSLGAAFSMPAAAHHNCVSPSCPEEIEDAMGMHEAAIEGLDMSGSGQQEMTTTTAEAVSPMDPADAAVGDARGSQDPAQTGWQRRKNSRSSPPWEVCR